jgi:hypothetical protein
VISIPTPLEIIATPPTVRVPSSSYTLAPLLASTWNFMLVSNTAPPTVDSLVVLDLEVDSYDMGRSSIMDPTLFIENFDVLPYPADFSSRQIEPGQLDICVPQNELTLACEAFLMPEGQADGWLTDPMSVLYSKPLAEVASQLDVSYRTPNKVTFEVVKGAAELLSFDAVVSVITPILPVEILAWDVTTEFTTTYQTSEVCFRGPNRYTFSTVSGSDDRLLSVDKGVYEPVRPVTQLSFDTSTFLATNIILGGGPEFTVARSIFDAKQFSDGILRVIGPTTHEHLPIIDTISFNGAHALQSNPFVTEFVTVVPNITRADSLRPQTSIFVDASHFISDRGLCNDEVIISMQNYFSEEYVEAGYMG